MTMSIIFSMIVKLQTPKVAPGLQLKADWPSQCIDYMHAFICVKFVVTLTYINIVCFQEAMKPGNSKSTGRSDVITWRLPALDHRNTRVMRAACEPNREPQ